MQYPQPLPKLSVAWAMPICLILQGDVTLADAPQEKVAKPHAVFVVGTHHYSPQLTIPPLAKQLEKNGFRCTVILPDGDPENDPQGIGDLSILRQADVAVFYLRFLTLPPEQLAEIERYLKSQKPVVGFRTTTHAFSYPQTNPSSKWNDGFGTRALGSAYKIHLKGGTEVSKVSGHSGIQEHPSSQDKSASLEHPILAGIDLNSGMDAAGTLYLSSPPSDANIFLVGTGNSKRTGVVENRFGRHTLQATMTSPVAWTWKNEWGGKVFATTLGHPKTFANPTFVRMCLQGIFWAADHPLPKDIEFQAIDVTNH